MRVAVRFLAATAALIALLSLIFAIWLRREGVPDVGYVGSAITGAAALYGILEWRLFMFSPALAAFLLLLALGVRLRWLRYVMRKRSSCDGIQRYLEILRQAERKSH